MINCHLKNMNIGPSLNISERHVIERHLPDNRHNKNMFYQFRPPIALRTDLSHITTELWEIPVLRMAH